jgi:hypothetical protein
MLRISAGKRGAASAVAAALASVGLPPTAVAASAPHSGHAPRAPSSHGHTIYQSRHLWATVDLCDTSTHPHMVGVRGSMPGSGLTGEWMYMRFRLQYKDAAGAWRDVGVAADSGFIDVGSSTFKARQAGRNFTVDAAAGDHYIVRGVVTFEWRREGHVVRNAQKETTTGHRVATGADPPGYSAAACELL